MKRVVKRDFLVQNTIRIAYKPPLGREGDPKVTKSGNMIAKVVIPGYSGTPSPAGLNPSFLLKVVQKVTKSDGIKDKLEHFLVTFCQEWRVQGARRRCF